MRRILPVLLSVAWLGACEPGPVKGPAEVRWDRETCTRCAMSVGDNRFAAQVREDVAPFRTHLFDDIGCALNWLEQQPGEAASKYELWVNNHRTSQWIDARQAWYIGGVQSPMGYNLAAVPESEEGAMDYEAAVRHIGVVEAGRRTRGEGHAAHVKVMEQ